MASTVVATHDPPPKGIPNPIHNDEGATSSGYAGALVAGVRSYGWAVGEIVADVGSTWLDSGWVDFTLRRPVFVDDVVTIEARDGQLSMTTSNGVVLDGTYGLGDGEFRAELNPPPVSDEMDPPEVRPTVDLDTIPIGVPLRPLGQYVKTEAAIALAADDLGIDPGPWADRIHPYFLSARMAPLTRHNFTYGPTIHVRSQIQHCGVPTPDQRITVGANIVDAYDRKGHWYQVLDGVVSDETQAELARIRHHTIFRPRPKD